MYKGSEDKALRGKLVGELGKVLKNKKLGDARFEALDALLELEDPKPAWKHISKQMPHPKKVEEGSPHRVPPNAKPRPKDRGFIRNVCDSSYAGRTFVASGPLRP